MEGGREGVCREVEAATFEVISHCHEDEPSELDLLGLVEALV